MNKWAFHPPKNFVIFLYILLLIMLSFFGSVYGNQLTLTWDKPDDDLVTGYNIYYGIFGTDFTSIPVQKICSENQTCCLISDVQEGEIFSFAATSFDADGNESQFSETIHAVIPPNDIDYDPDGFMENQSGCYGNDVSINPANNDINSPGINQDCNGSDGEFSVKDKNGDSGCFIQSFR